MLDDDPICIFQNVLDLVSDAYSAGDSKKLAGLISLPYLYQSLDTKTMLETMEDVLYGQDAFMQALIGKGVTRTIRLVSDATYLSANYIDGRYVTHLLRDTMPIMRSYVSRAVIRRTPDGWKLTENSSGLLHQIWPIRVFYVPEEPPIYILGQDADARREALEPLSIYQSHINRMTQANVDGDFDGYVKLCDFPHTVHDENNDQCNTQPEQVRGFFESVSEMLREHNVETFMRIGDHAEFLSGNEICGYHTAHFHSGGEPVLPPVKSRMILRREGVRWYMHSVTNSLSNTEYPYRHLEPSEDLMTQREIQKRTKTWPTLQ